MLKDVVVNLSGRAPQDFAAEYAVSVAATFGAHVAGIAFLYEPVIPDGTLGGVPIDLIELQREENSKAAKDAVGRFEAAVKQAGVSAETRILDATFGGAATLFAQIARRFDLAVVGQAQREHGASEDLMIEGALFESGRPLVVVPYIQKRGLTLERVLVCWDGGRTAARAIGDAMPFLERAKAVDIVIVAEERKNDEITGDQHERAPGAPRRRGPGQAHGQGRYRDRGRHPVLRRRQRRGLHGDGRLRAFPAARVHSRRRHARHSRVHDRAGIDVALTSICHKLLPLHLFWRRELRFLPRVICPLFPVLFRPTCFDRC